MNIGLAFNDEKRFWTVGSYVLKELSKQPEINLSGHARIPEDTGMWEEQCGLNVDLIIVIDDGFSHFKLHHHKGKFPKKTKTCIWLSDLHQQSWAAWRLQMIREFKYDHVFYAQKNFRKQVEDCVYEFGKSCSWLPHAADPEIFKPMPQIEKKYDIGYVGYLNEKRIKVAKVLEELVRFKHFSSIWAWSAARAINECKVGFNMSVEPTDNCNMRFFETMSCGIPLLTNYDPDNGMEEILGTNIEDKVLIYRNEAELKEKVVRLIASSELRRVLAERARNHFLAFHTYRNRTNTILGTMGFELLRSF